MKKLNKFFAVLVALAMMATLCVSMAFAAGAAGDGVTPASDDQKSADALLVKYLEVPNGVTIPEKTFTFNFVGLDSDTITAAEANAAKQTAPVTLKPTEKTLYANDENTVAAIQKIKELTWDFAAGPGEYTYRVTEDKTAADANNIETIDGSDKIEKYTYDPSSFIVRIYVDNTGNITNITVTDEAAPTSKQTTTENPLTGNGDYRANGLSFVNKYTKTDIKPTSDPDGLMKVTKVVPGTAGSKTQAFPFSIVLSAPTTEDATATIKYVDAAGVEQTVAFVNGTYTLNTTLKADQFIKFTQLPAGTTYKVTEDLAKETVAGTKDVKNYDKYTPKYQIDDAAEVIGTPGTLLATADTDLNDKAKNAITFTNTFDEESVKPEGILISNLPYIALALVAIGGLVAYVVVRRRQDDET